MSGRYASYWNASLFCEIIAIYIPGSKSSSVSSQSNSSASFQGSSSRPAFPTPNTPASGSDEAPPVPPARGKSPKLPIAAAPTPTLILTPPDLPPRNKGTSK